MSDNANAIAAVLTAIALLVTAFGGILVPIITRQRDTAEDDEIRAKLLELMEERDQEQAAEIDRLNQLLKERSYSDD